MNCSNPYVNSKGQAFGCGQCLPCRVRRKRIWTHRILLEASQWESNAFVTLTYSDSEMPLDGVTQLPTLVPRHVQLMLKRLRRQLVISPRFFVTGEYGDRTLRPHYHMALFNFHPCERGETKRVYPSGRLDALGCCRQCAMVQRAWGLGDVDVRVLEKNRAGYVAGYVVKKLDADRDKRLEDRHPQFARMSLKPGIGANIVPHIARVLVQHDIQADDVPVVLRHGKKMMPLGRYLRRKLRFLVTGKEECPDEIVVQLQEEVRLLWESLEAAQTHSTVGSRWKKEILKNALVDQNLGVLQSLENRQKRNKGAL